MIAYCGRASAASFCDPFPYIVSRYARETIAEICSLARALVTAIIAHTGSSVGYKKHLKNRRGVYRDTRCAASTSMRPSFLDCMQQRDVKRGLFVLRFAFQVAWTA